MNDMDHRDQLKALKRLAEHLSALDSGSGTEPTMESDMLSLIISGTLNGEDIARLYPDFHQKLLENPELRQAFLDALESVEAERAGELTPMPGAEKTSLSFLEEPSPAPKIELFDGQTWRAKWQRTLEQLQGIFSPPQMAYRADPSLAEDPWFTLLREEMKVGGNTYDVLLDCTLSDEDSLSTTLNLAVTLGSARDSAQFPLRADLEWGDYHESILLADEGRVRFPDIPLESVFDQAGAQLKAGFNLTLETA
jgi:hypothetical protein